MELAAKIGTMAKNAMQYVQEGVLCSNSGSNTLGFVYSDVALYKIPVIGGHSLTFSGRDASSYVVSTYFYVHDENDNHLNYISPPARGASRTVTLNSDAAWMIFCLHSRDRWTATIYDNTDERYLLKDGLVITEGEGGTKCLTPRRSYRRLARPSARFCAHSQEWEVAA